MVEKSLEGTPLHYWINESNSDRCIVFFHPAFADHTFYEINLRFKRSSFRYLASLGSLINKVKTAPRDYELLFGVGEQDNEMALKASTQWYEHEKESRFIIFKGAGHIVNMDTPEAFNRELEKIL